jgi:transposase-like protein
LDDAQLMAVYNRVIAGLKKKCVRCASKAAPYTDSPILLRCTWAHCGKRFSLVEGTPFYNSHLPTLIVLKVLRMWCAKVSLCSIAELLGISRQTVSAVIKKLKTPLIRNYYSRLDKIGGKDIIVEIDESKFGKVKYHRGHRVKGVWVFGMVERTPARRIVFVPVNDRKRETLTNVLKKYVDEQSIIHSDCWRSYNELCNHFSAHKTVNHSENFVDPVTNTHTNTIEGNWCGVKSQTTITHRTKNFVELYLIRYILRRNYKDMMFEMLIKYLF